MIERKPGQLWLACYDDGRYAGELYLILEVEPDGIKLLFPNDGSIAYWVIDDCINDQLQNAMETQNE